MQAVLLAFVGGSTNMADNNSDQAKKKGSIPVREYPIEHVRNIGIAAHIDAGKNDHYRAYSILHRFDPPDGGCGRRAIRRPTGWSRKGNVVLLSLRPPLVAIGSKNPEGICEII